MFACVQSQSLCDYNLEMENVSQFNWPFKLKSAKVQFINIFACLKSLNLSSLQDATVKNLNYNICQKVFCYYFFLILIFKCILW